MGHEWSLEEFTEYILKLQAKRRAKRKQEADSYEIAKHLDLKLGKKRVRKPNGRK